MMSHSVVKLAILESVANLHYKLPGKKHENISSASATNSCFELLFKQEAGSTLKTHSVKRHVE